MKIYLNLSKLCIVNHRLFFFPDTVYIVTNISQFCTCEVSYIVKRKSVIFTCIFTKISAHGLFRWEVHLPISYGASLPQLPNFTLTPVYTSCMRFLAHSIGMSLCNREASVVRPSVCKLLHASRYFYHKHDSIATKLAHDGPHMDLHPSVLKVKVKGHVIRALL